MGRIAKSLAAAASVVILILLALISNTGVQTSERGGIRVTATFFPIYDWARNIVGDKATVTNLTPPGMDPHDLDPNPQDLSAILSSDAFLYSGVGLEAWVQKVLPMIDRTRTVVVDVSPGIDLIRNEAGYADPHFWLDPLLAITAIANIELGVEHVDPANSGYYRQNAQKYVDRLRSLHDSFVANLTSVRIRTFITFHEAFGYWKRVYGLTEVGIYGFEPEGEPSAAHMQELLRLAERHQIRSVLASNLDDPHWCQVLANQIGGKVLVLDPLEGPTAEQHNRGSYTYIGRLYDNITVLRASLA